MGRESAGRSGDNAGRDATAPVDFAFLETQTVGDVDLERDLLTLFVAQAERILPTLPDLSPERQADTAHLLKGSSRGIGAWPAAAAADAYEAALPSARPLAYATLTASFAATLAAIAGRLTELA